MGNNIASVGDIIRVHGAERADQVSVVQGERSLTWGQLYTRSKKLSRALEAVGVRAETRVSFLDKNSIEHSPMPLNRFGKKQ